MYYVKGFITLKVISRGSVLRVKRVLKQLCVIYNKFMFSNKPDKEFTILKTASALYTSRRFTTNMT